MPNKALRTLYTYNGIFVFAGALFGPLYAVYVQEIRADVTAVSLSWGVFLISTTLFTFIVSKFGDHVKEKEYLLLSGFLIRALVWALYIFADSITFLIILQILLGIGESLGTPGFNALIADHIDKKREVEEFADLSIIFNLASALAVILGGLIVAKYGFPILFSIMSLLALASFLGVLLKPRKML
jgi:MFS transporter, DHA1 family, multidrug resistance protein